MSRSVSELTAAITHIQEEVDKLDEVEVSYAEARALYSAADELYTSCDGLKEDVGVLGRADARKETDEKDSEL